MFQMSNKLFARSSGKARKRARGSRRLLGGEKGDAIKCRPVSIVVTNSILLVFLVVFRSDFGYGGGDPAKLSAMDSGS